MTHAPIDLRLPPERFYWAQLNTASLPRSLTPGRQAKQLGYLLEPMLPVTLESVHTSYLRINASRIIACAMTHEELDRVTDAASLGPEVSPPFIDGDVSRVNLLTGSHEPRAIRARRFRLAVFTAAAMVLCTAVILLGLQQRIRSARTSLHRIQSDQVTVYERVLPLSQSTQPPELRLIAELRQLQRTRTASVEATADVSPSLADLLASWPMELEIRTRSIILSQASATITATATNHKDAQSLADALGRATHWRATNPQVRPDRDAVQLTLRLERKRAKEDPAQ